MKHFVKQVKSTIIEMMCGRMPQFELIENNHKDNLLFRSQVSSNLDLYIYFVILRRDQSFNVELAWSHKKYYPYNLIGRTYHDEPVNGEMRFRISTIWTPPNSEEQWWNISKRDEAEDKIRGLIDDAICKIETFGLPYFDSIRNT